MFVMTLPLSGAIDPSHVHPSCSYIAHLHMYSSLLVEELICLYMGRLSGNDIRQYIPYTAFDPTSKAGMSHPIPNVHMGARHVSDKPTWSMAVSRHVGFGHTFPTESCGLPVPLAM